MIDAVAATLIGIALVLAAVSALMLLLKRPVGLTQYIGAAIAELALAVQAVLAVVKLAGGQRPDGGTLIFSAYLVGSLFLIPVATVWARVERTRWGSGVLVIGYLVMAVLIVRMQQIWRTPHA